MGVTGIIYRHKARMLCFASIWLNDGEYQKYFKMGREEKESAFGNSNTYMEGPIYHGREITAVLDGEVSDWPERERLVMLRRHAREHCSYSKCRRRVSRSTILAAKFRRQLLDWV